MSNGDFKQHYNVYNGIPYLGLHLICVNQIRLTSHQATHAVISGAIDNVTQDCLSNRRQPFLQQHFWATHVTLPFSQ